MAKNLEVRYIPQSSFFPVFYVCLNRWTLMIDLITSHSCTGAVVVTSLAIIALTQTWSTDLVPRMPAAPPEYYDLGASVFTEVANYGRAILFVFSATTGNLQVFLARLLTLVLHFVSTSAILYVTLLALHVVVCFCHRKFCYE